MRVTAAATGRLTPEDLTPEAEEEFARLFRAWTDGNGDADGGGGSESPD